MWGGGGGAILHKDRMQQRAVGAYSAGPASAGPIFCEPL